MAERRGRLQTYRFDGGLDDTSSPWILASNVLAELNNADLSERGALKKAKGKTRFISTSLGTGAVEALGIFPLGGTKWYLIAHGTKIYASTGSSWTEIASGLTAANGYFVATPTFVYFFNGAQNLKWNGTTLYGVGIAAPTSAPTLNTTTNGSLTAGRTYKYKYTYYNSSLGLESDPSPESATLTASADPDDGFKLDLTGSSDPQVDKIRVYRTYGNTNAPFWYEGDIANASGTVTYSSTVSDANLSTIMAPESNAKPPAGTMPVLHFGRLFLVSASEPNKILFSEPAPDIEYFPAYNFIYTSDMAPVTGMVSSHEDLYVFTADSVQVLNTPYAEDPSTAWSITKVLGSGCVAPRSVVSCKDLIFYLNRSGVMVFDGQNAKLIKPLPNLNQTYASMACACYHNERYFIAVPEGNDTTPNQLYELILDTGAWIKHPNVKACRVLFSDNGVLYAGSPTAGLVYKFFDSDEDDGSAFTFSFKTGWIDFNDYSQSKRGIKLYLPGMSGTGTITVNVTGNSSHSDECNISGFQYYKFEQDMTGQAFQIGISHTSKTPFSLHGLVLLYEVLGEV